MRDRVLRGRLQRDERRSQRLGLVEVLGRAWVRKAVAERRAAQEKAGRSRGVKVVTSSRAARLKRAARRAARAEAEAEAGGDDDDDVTRGSLAGDDQHSGPAAGSSFLSVGSRGRDSGAKSSALAGGSSALPAGPSTTSTARARRTAAELAEARRARKKRLRALVLSSTLADGPDALTEPVTVTRVNGTVVTVTVSDVRALPADVLSRLMGYMAKGETDRAEALLGSSWRPKPRVAAPLAPAAGATSVVRRAETEAGVSGGAATGGDEGRARVPPLHIGSVAAGRRVRGRPGNASGAVWGRFGQRALGAREVEAVAAEAGRRVAAEARVDATQALLETAAREGDLLGQLGRARRRAEEEASGAVGPSRAAGSAREAGEAGAARPGGAGSGGAPLSVPGLAKGQSAIDAGRVTVGGRPAGLWEVGPSSGKLLPDPASLVRLFDIGRTRAAAMAGGTGAGAASSMLADSLMTSSGVPLGREAEAVTRAADGAHTAAVNLFAAGKQATDVAAAAAEIRAERARLAAAAADASDLAPALAAEARRLADEASLVGRPAGGAVADVAGPLGGSSAAAMLVGEIAAAAARASMMRSRRGRRDPRRPGETAGRETAGGRATTSGRARGHGDPFHGGGGAGRAASPAPRGRARDFTLLDAPGAAQGPPEESVGALPVSAIAGRLAADPRLRSGAGLTTGLPGPGAGHGDPDSAGGVDWGEAAGHDHDDVDAAMARTLRNRPRGPALPPLPASVATQPSRARAGGAGSAAGTGGGAGGGGTPAGPRSLAVRAAELSAEQRAEAEAEEMLERYPPMSTRHERKVSVAVASRGEPSLYFAGDGHLFEGSDGRRHLHASDSLSLIRGYELAVAGAAQRARHSRADEAAEAVTAVRDANASLHMAHWARVRQGWRGLRDEYHFGLPGDGGPFGTEGAAAAARAADGSTVTSGTTL